MKHCLFIHKVNSNSATGCFNILPLLRLFLYFACIVDLYVSVAVFITHISLFSKIPNRQSGIPSCSASPCHFWSFWASFFPSSPKGPALSSPFSPFTVCCRFFPHSSVSFSVPRLVFFRYPFLTHSVCVCSPQCRKMAAGIVQNGELCEMSFTWWIDKALILISVFCFFWKVIEFYLAFWSLFHGIVWLFWSSLTC